jgi:hypothetical protein
VEYPLTQADAGHCSVFGIALLAIIVNAATFDLRVVMAHVGGEAALASIEEASA